MSSQRRMQAADVLFTWGKCLGFWSQPFPFLPVGVEGCGTRPDLPRFRDGTTGPRRVSRVLSGEHGLA